MTVFRPEESGPDDARLIDLAGHVSDRRDVDWDQASAEAPVLGLDALRTLGRLAAAFDAEQRHDSAAAGTEPPLFTWGHLEVLDTLGEGRFGEVYRAHDPQLGRDVALKLAREEQNETPRRGLAEARRLAQIRHPNVLALHGAAVHDGRVGIWCDLLRGQTLEDRLGRDGTFSEGELRLVGTELCRALAAVHGAGLVHGDVKPGNVVRDDDGKWVLVDFGASRWASAQPAAFVQATPSYLAPEVARGDASPTGGSDLYALGALLYRLATAEFWRGAESRPLRDARPDLTADSVRAVESMLAERPEDRPKSAGAAERLLDGARAPTHPSRLGPLWVAALLLVLALVLTALWVRRSQEPSLANEAEGSAPAVLWAQRGGDAFAVSDGDTLRTGDRLSLRIELSEASHVYVFNEDDAGELFVLFPLPGAGLENPLPRGRHRLPSGEQSWQVTSAGGREHFLVVGSAEPRPELERFRIGRDIARLGRRVQTGQVEALRGVGGLTPEAPPSSPSSELKRLHDDLASNRSTAEGLWVKLLVVENPPL